MKVLRIQVGLALLICCGAIAGACAAYDVRFRDIVRAFLHVAGFQGVELRPAALHETIVPAGSELSVEAGHITLRKVPAEAMVQRLAWAGLRQKDGWITFQGETLESVAAAFNQHNGRQLVIGDAATSGLRVGGKFRATDLDGFLAALEITHGVKAAVRARTPGQKVEVVVLTGGAGASGSAYPEDSKEPAPAE